MMMKGPLLVMSKAFFIELEIFFGSKILSLH